MTDEDYYEEGEEDESCDYGPEFCVEPSLKSLNCCFECWLYLEMCEDQEAEQKKKKEAKPHE